MANAKERIVYLNGELVPESNAKISVFDRGFIWGDGVYDAARTFAGKPFRMWEHVERLYRSLKYVRIDIGVKKEDFFDTVLKVIDLNVPLLPPGSDYLVRIHVSRGNLTSEGSVHESQASAPTVTIFCMPISFGGYAKFYRQGVPLVTPATRRIPPQSLSPKAKVAGKMNNFVAAFEAKAVHPDALPLILDLNGNLTESTGANFQFISKGVLRVPNRLGVLEGVSMGMVMELAGQLGIPVDERDYTPFDVYNGDEGFLTAGTFCILPAASLNGLPIGTGEPGPVTQQFLAAWSKLVGVDIVEQAERQAGLRR